MKQNELREWLVEHQEHCPGCGKRSSPWDHLHHVWVRRLGVIRDHLWSEINIALVCPQCHVPEAEGLNLNCALQKFSMGFTPTDVRDWMDSLPLKVKPGLPGFFLEAEMAYEGMSARGEVIG